MLDPTRVTLYIGDTGMSGFEFREDVLMRRFGIQINKTSINSVLLIFTIGVTWSSVHYLLDALRRIAEQLTRAQDAAGPADRALHRRKIENLTLGLPALPNFSDFDSAFKADPRCPDGDMRAAFYAGYTETNREYIPLDAAQTAGRRRPHPGLHQLRRPLSTRIPDPGTRPGRLDRHPRLPASGRRQGDPRLPTRTGPVRVHRNRPRSSRAPPWEPGRHPRHCRRSGRPGAGARSQRTR